MTFEEAIASSIWQERQSGEPLFKSDEHNEDNSITYYDDNESADAFDSNIASNIASAAVAMVMGPVEETPSLGGGGSSKSKDDDEEEERKKRRGRGGRR